MNRRTHRITLTWLAALGLAFGVATASAQEPETAWPEDEPRPFPITDTQARDIAWRFLTAGPDPLRPGLPRAALDGVACKLVSDPCPMSRGRLLWLDGRRQPMRCDLKLAPSGRVFHFLCDRPGFRYDAPRSFEEDTSDAGIEADLRARSLRTLDDLRGRARAFLAATYRRFEARNFVLQDVGRFRGSPFEVMFTFTEEPRPGQLAVFRNVLQVSLNPETGAVVRFWGADVEAVATAPPAISEARARALVAEAHPGVRIRYVEPFIFLRRAAPRLAWRASLGEESVFVDGTTGEVLFVDETG